MPNDRDDLTDAQREHREAETEVFGADPVRNPDGTPMERGHGSRFSAMPPAAKAHYHAIETRVAVDEVISLAKQLAAASEKLARTHKETVDSAAASKADAAKVAANEQRIAERDQPADRRTPFARMADGEQPFGQTGQPSSANAS